MSRWFAIAFLCCALSGAAFADDSETDMTTATPSSRYNGIGFNFGMLAFFPSEVNDMIKDIYDELKSGYYIVGETGTPSIFLAYPFKVKGMFYLNPRIALEPNAQVLWTGKLLFISGAGDEKAWVNLFFFSGGLNGWVRFNPEKRISFKMGLGGFGGYSLVKVTGDIGEVTLGGTGYGGNLLAGLDITFSRVAINIDFVIPVGVINYSRRDGNLDIVNQDNPYSGYTGYPERLLLLGFEFRPGITIKF